MKSMYRVLAAVPLCALIFMAFTQSVRSQPSPAFERTEDRVDCDSYEPLKQPFFGETHLHTSFSFDAYTLSVRNDPDAAYQFAKGGEVMLPDASARAGEPQTRTAQLRRPIDFAAITDHSELFGEMEICTRSADGTAGRDSFQCKQMRSGELFPGNSDSFNPTAVTGLWAFNSLLRPDGAGPLLPLCGDASAADCDAAAVSIWQSVQQAAEDAYDRSSNCSFTSFVAYEYTAQPQLSNLHRNVIFRNADVPERAIGNVATGGPFPTVLWEKLREECVDKEGDCDVLTIPHNANLSGGIMFPDPDSVEEATERAFFEPLTEIYQHKAASECRYDRLTHTGVDTTDELCTFEQALADILGPQPNPPDIEDYPRRNMIRNVLKDGIALAPSYSGINPFKYGLIGGTDSHNGDPGNTVEQDFQGHAGTADAPMAAMINSIRLSPGALAVVWAEENSRDSIFSAMRRKETYATSGTRPIVRFFGGWEYDDRRAKLCNQPDRVEIGYEKGVPMGGDLPPQSRRNPTFLVAALRDPESARLQSIQIVKGWVDRAGRTQEQVVTVAGKRGQADPRYDPEVCNLAASSGHELQRSSRRRDRTRGANELCAVWKDERFNPEQPAFYYARVLEAPTCRWSTLACQAAGVDPFASPRRCQRQAAAANFDAFARGEIDAGEEPFNNCCLTERNDPFMERTIQERAWTSPIWYAPDG